MRRLSAIGVACYGILTSSASSSSSAAVSACTDDVSLCLQAAAKDAANSWRTHLLDVSRLSPELAAGTTQRLEVLSVGGFVALQTSRTRSVYIEDPSSEDGDVIGADEQSNSSLSTASPQRLDSVADADEQSNFSLTTASPQILDNRSVAFQGNAPEICAMSFSGYEEPALLGTACILMVVLPLVAITIFVCVRVPPHTFLEIPFTPRVEYPLPDRDLPSTLSRLMYLAVFLISVNVTIAVPQSHSVVTNAGGNIAFSGFVLGAYGCGMFMSLPIFVYFSSVSYKGGLMFIASSATVGNIAYILAPYGGSTSSPWLLAAARLVCGFEGGGLALVTIIILRCSTGALQRKALGMWMMSASSGMLFGPLLSSISVQALGSENPEMPPALLMAVASVLYGCVVASYCPNNATCHEMCGISSDLSGIGKPPLSERKTPREEMLYEHSVLLAWLDFVLLGVFNMVRTGQRVLWEMSAIIVLTETYGLSSKAAGFLVAIPVSLVFLLPLVLALRTRMGPLRFLHLTEGLQLLGLLLMFWPGPVSPIMFSSLWKFQLTLFMLGSTLFYCGNVWLALSYNSLLPAFAVPGHWLLCMERTAASFTIWQSAGIFVGPMLGGVVLEHCRHQNLAVCVLLAIGLGNSFGNEIGLRVLIARRPELLCS